MMFHAKGQSRIWYIMDVEVMVLTTFARRGKAHKYRIAESQWFTKQGSRLHSFICSRIRSDRKVSKDAPRCEVCIRLATWNGAKGEGGARRISASEERV